MYGCGHSNCCTLVLIVLLFIKAVESGRNLVALSCSIKLVTAIVSAEKRDTPITDVSIAHIMYNVHIQCILHCYQTTMYNVHIQCILHCYQTTMYNVQFILLPHGLHVHVLVGAFIIVLFL